MNNYVEVKKLVKIFPGGVRAVDNVTFTVKKGQFICLLGPSGCGKTTILRCIAGLEKPDYGEILVDGEVYNSTEKGIMILPNRRNLGMVFQSYAVWPHMSVFDNIAYGLRMKKASKDEIDLKVRNIIKVVDLEGLSDRAVTKLSGGQQQRVAIARALVYNPKLLLFDEPLSNLDSKLRERMRLEMKKLQREIGITSVYVTHDQAEAMTLSKEIIIMKDGRIEQIGSPIATYARPRNKFVSDFIGMANFLNGKVIRKRGVEGNYGICEVSDGGRSYELRCTIPEEVKEGDDVVLFFRPEHTEIIKIPTGNWSNTVKGKISNLVYLGDHLDCRIKVGEMEIRARIPPQEVLNESDEVSIKIDPEYCLCFLGEK